MQRDGHHHHQRSFLTVAGYQQTPERGGGGSNKNDKIFKQNTTRSFNLKTNFPFFFLLLFLITLICYWLHSLIITYSYYLLCRRRGRQNCFSLFFLFTLFFVSHREFFFFSLHCRCRARPPIIIYYDTETAADCFRSLRARASARDVTRMHALARAISCVCVRLMTS